MPRRVIKKHDIQSFSSVVGLDLSFNKSIVIFVRGDPKAAKRKRAFAFSRKDGSTGARMYSDTKSSEYTWREMLALHLKDHIPDPPISGPVSVSWIAYFKRPKSHYRTGRFSHLLKENHRSEEHTPKPDRDNLDKVVLDVLKSMGFFDKDDCQACIGTLRKKWAGPDDKPGMLIGIEWQED